MLIRLFITNALISNFAVLRTNFIGLTVTLIDYLSYKYALPKKIISVLSLFLFFLYSITIGCIMSERKRIAISWEDKFEIISKRAKGEKSKDLMVEFGLSASTIATIVSNKVKIIAEHEKNKSEND